MKEHLQGKSQLEKKAVRIVECLLEDSVKEKVLIDSVGLRDGSLLHYRSLG